jgi:peroxin-14
MSTQRVELINSAITFLNDPKVKDATLANKISFLESKGLTPSEIQTALNSASSPGTLPVITSTTGSWKSLFYGIGTLSALGFGIYHLGKTYILPLIDFPTANELSSQTKEIQSNINSSITNMTQIQTQTTELTKLITEQSKKTTDSIQEINSLLTTLSQKHIKTGEDYEELKSELEELKSSLPKLIEKYKIERENVVSELRMEIKSLKELMMSKSTAGGIVIGKPKIPEWQLQAAKMVKKEKEVIEIKENNGLENKVDQDEVESKTNKDVVDKVDILGSKQTNVLEMDSVNKETGTVGTMEPQNYKQSDTERTDSLNTNSSQNTLEEEIGLDSLSEFQELSI